MVKKKHTIRNVFLIILILVILVGGVIFLFPEVVLGTNFVKPSWARLECLPTDAYEGGYHKWLDQQTIFRCDGFTEECEFNVEHTGSGFLVRSLRTEYRDCNLGGGACTPWKSLHLNDGEKETIPKIKSGRQYEFNTGGLNIGEQYGKVTIEWKPWKLYRMVGGAKWIVNSYNCDITSGAKPKIRLVDYPSVGKLYRTGGEGMKWINYVDDWVYGPNTNVFNHPQYGEVYCSAGQIFDIVELKMADNRLVKIDPEYSKTLPNGDVLSGLGSKLANVECCPNEPNCGSDFEYLPEPEPDKECFTDIQCFSAGGPVPKTPTSYTTWNCNPEGICVESEPITVECTSSAHCLEGSICDLSTMNYGKCIDQIIGDYCGDGTCDITESFKTCPADCLAPPIECKWYESYYERETCGFSPLCWAGIVQPKIEKGCKLAFWVYLVIFGGVLLIIIFMILLIKGKRVSPTPTIIIRK